jgi:hypothetical protein
MAEEAVIPVSLTSSTSPADRLRLPGCSTNAPDVDRDAWSGDADSFWSSIAVTEEPVPTYSEINLVTVPAVGMTVAIAASDDSELLFPARDKY